MAFARVQTKAGTSDSGGSGTTSCPVTLDATPTAGNLLVATINSVGAAALITPAITNWTAGPHLANGSCEVLMFYRVAGAGEAALVTATWGGGATHRAVMIVREYSGNSANQGIVADTPVSNTAQGSSATPSVTSAGASVVQETLFVAGVAHVNATPTTMTLITDSFGNESAAATTGGSGTAAGVIHLIDKIEASGDSSAVAGGTLSTSRAWDAAVMAFQPSSVVAPDSGYPYLGSGFYPSR